MKATVEMRLLRRVAVQANECRLRLWDMDCQYARDFRRRNTHD